MQVLPDPPIRWNRPKVKSNTQILKASDYIYLRNDHPDSTIYFTLEEWEAFKKEIKEGVFD